MEIPINPKLNVSPVRKVADDSTTAQRNPQIQPGTPGDAVTQDEVTLTGTAQQLRAVQDIAFAAPVVDSDKVTSIRSLIDAGQYQVNPERIADKLLAFEYQLKAS